MVLLEKHISEIDMSAIALPDDKLEECKYFFGLLSREKNRDKFRWLLSAFLGACYSYLEIRAKSLYNAFNDPETGEPFEDEESLSILRKYVRTFQNKNNTSYVKTSGLHVVTKVLYKIRKENTHNYSLSIMKNGESLPEDFCIGYLQSEDIPALQFCREVLELFNKIEEELSEA